MLGLPRILLTLNIFSFLRKGKSEQHTKESAQSGESPSATMKIVGEADASKAKGELKVFSLEREVLSAALTAIYEAETRGTITEADRDRLVSKYSGELRELEGKIAEVQKTIEIYELQKSREELLRSFNEKLEEINARISRLSPEFTPSTSKPKEEHQEASKPEETEAEPSQPKEKAPKEKPRSKAEERIEAIKEEVLKAMERLEQIEVEG